MKAPLLAVVALLGAAVFLVPGIGLGGGDSRKVLEAKVLAPLPTAYLRTAGTIRGVPGAGAQWSIGDSEIDLRSDGHLEIDVHGLIVTPLGFNPLRKFKAIVSCQTIVNGAPDVTNVSTDPLGFDANTAGDAMTETNVALPMPCIAPIVFVTTLNGSWIAATGR
jgi:hypothetical protein